MPTVPLVSFLFSLSTFWLTSPLENYFSRLCVHLFYLIFVAVARSKVSHPKRQASRDTETTPLLHNSNNEDDSNSCCTILWTVFMLARILWANLSLSAPFTMACIYGVHCTSVHELNTDCTWIIFRYYPDLIYQFVCLCTMRDREDKIHSVFFVVINLLSGRSLTVLKR